MSLRSALLAALVATAPFCLGCGGAADVETRRESKSYTVTRQRAYDADVRVPAWRDARTEREAEAPRTHVRRAGYIWPARGRVLTRFGDVNADTGERSRGIDIAVSPGDPVVAVQDGTVCFASTDFYDFGQVVMIRHHDGLATWYAHNRELLVQSGKRVRQGDRIALAGRTGRAQRPTLHFRVLRLSSGRPRNPMLHLPRF
jgi:murein DD-endopeptidase MepM/ murein hydrolase activator NlpD